MSETATMEAKTWTEERDAALRENHAEGLSASQIADRMGLRRNQVIGRIHRLGIQRGGQRRTTQRVKRVLEPKGKLPATVKARPLPPVGLRALLDKAKREAPKPLPVEPGHAACGTSLLDLEPHQCKWPVTNELPHMFCGADRVQSLPYCEAHARRAYYAGSNLRPVGLPYGVIEAAA